MKKKSAIIIILTVFIFLVGSFAYIKKDFVYAKMYSWRLIPRPEVFTELYFEDYESIPKSTVINTPFTFEFTIHNLEGATTTYPYIVYFEYPFGKQVVLLRGTFTLADKEYRTIPVSHTFSASDMKGQIVVQLENRNQKINLLFIEDKQ